jgi:hypothetical protein
MDELVERLSHGEHPVEMTLRPDKTIQTLREDIERGYVHIKFTGTRGGTELGVRLDKHACDFSSVDFDAQTGRARFVGELTLNYVPVECIADVDMTTFEGTGRLRPRPSDAPAAGSSSSLAH